MNLGSPQVCERGELMEEFRQKERCNLPWGIPRPGDQNEEKKDPVMPGRNFEEGGHPSLEVESPKVYNWSPFVMWEN